MRVIEANMERRRNEGAVETGNSQENPPTNGIVRHDSHLRNSSDPAGNAVRCLLGVIVETLLRLVSSRGRRDVLEVELQQRFGKVGSNLLRGYDAIGRNVHVYLAPGGCINVVAVTPAKPVRRECVHFHRCRCRLLEAPPSPTLLPPPPPILLQPRHPGKGTWTRRASSYYPASSPPFPATPVRFIPGNDGCRPDRRGWFSKSRMLANYLLPDQPFPLTRPIKGEAGSRRSASVQGRVETGDPRENPREKPGATPPGIEPERSVLTVAWHVRASDQRHWLDLLPRFTTDPPPPPPPRGAGVGEYRDTPAPRLLRGHLRPPVPAPTSCSTLLASRHVTLPCCEERSNLLQTSGSIASHQDKPDTIPVGVTPEFLHVGTVAADAIGWGFLGVVPFATHTCVYSPLRFRLTLPTSGLKTSNCLLASHQCDLGSISGRVTPEFRMWESCRTMPLGGGFSRGSLVSPALSFRRCSILTSITLIGSQDLDAKSRRSPYPTTPACILAQSNGGLRHAIVGKFARRISVRLRAGHIRVVSGLYVWDHDTRREVSKSRDVRGAGKPVQIKKATGEICATVPSGIKLDLATAQLPCAFYSDIPAAAPITLLASGDEVGACESPSSAGAQLTKAARDDLQSPKDCANVGGCSATLPTAHLVQGESRHNTLFITIRLLINGPMYAFGCSLNSSLVKAVHNKGEMRRVWNSSRMQWRGRTGDSRENPLTDGIVWQDSHMRESWSDPARNRTPFAMVGEYRSSPYANLGNLDLNCLLCVGISCASGKTEEWEKIAHVSKGFSAQAIHLIKAVHIAMPPHLGQHDLLAIQVIAVESCPPLALLDMLCSPDELSTSQATPHASSDPKPAPRGCVHNAPSSAYLALFLRRPEESTLTHLALARLYCELFYRRQAHLGSSRSAHCDASVSWRLLIAGHSRCTYAGASNHCAAWGDRMHPDHSQASSKGPITRVLWLQLPSFVLLVEVQTSKQQGPARS
ncbi:hypothetical protein PR048_018517 [Dryococelus australis]|uniref:Uncharacterized protein n=1 Tax=Dryococelus australis TaxID=614101 RepID=A0ABQ9HCN5_9NEOP|nr:hypothetical protein PR048_018517 [Dryococelus australis]